jgi:lipoprotein-anchoring transpeptidase ErfK/SrfK
MTRRACALAIAGAALAFPAAAAGQDPVPTPTPTPPPPPAPQLAIKAERTLTVGKGAYVLSGHRYRLSGAMTPAVPGEHVTLQVFHDGKRKRTQKVPVAADGTFRLKLKAGKATRVSFRVVHRPTAALAAARGPKVSVTVLRPSLTVGERGPLVRLLQRGLAKLRYAVPRNDVFDDATGRAVMAYRKVNGMSRLFTADKRVIERVIAGKGAFKPKHPDAGRHIEADISRQVLALIDDGKVLATYHTSTGAPATPTIIGSFEVYRKDPGTNALGMYKSSYFIRGYAIHGYVSVPAFNASHGCLRVPMEDASRIYNWVRMGTRVITYP